jgi:hypothetical protein
MASASSRSFFQIAIPSNNPKHGMMAYVLINTLSKGSYHTAAIASPFDDQVRIEHIDSVSTRGRMPVDTRLGGERLVLAQRTLAGCARDFYARFSSNAQAGLLS